jgi:hypothetical protein
MQRDRKAVVVTRDELYRQVWETPMRTLAEGYGISGNGLAKICTKLNIPFPGRGYWAKAQAGRKMRRPPLPPADKGTPTSWTISETVKLPPELPAEIKETVEAARQTGDLIKVRTSGPFRHPLVQGWKTVADKKLPHRKGVWERENPTVVSRRFRILDALFVAFEGAGGVVKAKNSILDGFSVTFGSNVVSARLVERLKQVREPILPTDFMWEFHRDRPWRQKLAGTGQLVLRIESHTDEPCRKQWQDTARHTLEEQLTEVLAAFVHVAHLVGLREQRCAEERAKRAIEQQRRDELDRQYRMRQQRLDQVVEAADRWKQCERIHAFIRHMEERAACNPKLSGSPELAQWLSWVRARVDEADPTDATLKALLSDPPPRS